MNTINFVKQVKDLTAQVKTINAGTSVSKLDSIQKSVNDVANYASRNNPTLPCLANLLDAVYTSKKLDANYLAKTVRYGNKAWYK